jgi:hypothetical protein
MKPRRLMKKKVPRGQKILTRNAYHGRQHHTLDDGHGLHSITGTPIISNLDNIAIALDF